jgi:hypothetical protein
MPMHWAKFRCPLLTQRPLHHRRATLVSRVSSLGTHATAAGDDSAGEGQGRAGRGGRDRQL